MSTTVATLGEIAEQVGGVIQTGPFGSQLHRSDYREEGTPVVMPQDIVDDRIVITSIARVDDQIVNKLARHQLKVGDIIFPRRGDLGKRAIITEEQEGWLCGTGCIKISIANGPLHPHYLFYYLKQPQVIKWIENKAVGATMLNLNMSILESVEVKYPPYPIQAEIADILSAYDDLIANNRRRMALLEEAIHLLYREWFVRLRFPGHERVKVVGGVPEGWEKSTIENAFQILGGGTPSRKEERYWAEGTINWYSPSDLTKSQSMFMESSSDKITDLGLANSSARLFPPFSVMMTSRATIGAISINTTEACTNQGFITCLPNERIPVYFLYCWLLTNIDIFTNLATGATFKEISKGVFKKIPILLPSERLTQEFQEYVQPMAETVLNLQRQNQKLTEARDSLLPRLMTGELSV